MKAFHRNSSSSQLPRSLHGSSAQVVRRPAHPHNSESSLLKPRTAPSDLMARKSQALHSRLGKVQPHEVELIGSGYHFYRTLYQISRKESITLKVPDALLFGFGFTKPTLVYTNEAGVLQFKKGIEHYQYDSLLDVFQSLNLFQTRLGLIQPLMIVKIGNGRFNRVLLRRSDAYEEWRSREKNPEQCVMQHYILPKGRKACKVRAILKGSEFKLFSISNKRRLDGKKDINPKQSLIAACGTLEEARRLYGTRFTPITNNSKGHVSNAPQRKEENPITVNATFDLSPVGETFLKRFSEEYSVKIPLKEASDSQSPRQEVEKVQDLEDPKKLRKNKLISAPDFEINSSRLKARAEHYKEVEIDIENIIEEQPDKSRKLQRPKAKANEDSEEIDKLLADTKAGALEIGNRINRTKLYGHLLSIKNPSGEDRAFERTDSPLPGNYAAILRERYCTDVSDYKKTDIYEVKSKAMVDTVEALVQGIRAQVEKFHSAQTLQITELVCDFVEDSNGQFWFLKLKSYSVTDASGQKRTALRNRPHRKRCAGVYCEEICTDQSLNASLTQQLRFCTMEEEFDGSQKRDDRRYMVTKRLIMLDSLLNSAKLQGEMETFLKPQLLERVEVCANCYKAYKLREFQLSQTEASLKHTKTAAIRRDEYLRRLVDEVNTLKVPVEQQSFTALPRLRSVSALRKPLERPKTTQVHAAETPVIRIDSTLC